ncbi:MAG: cytochrome c biogenesis protein CcsA [Romboutsia sp.]|nr:cytochrome c biogenesis protein CcsA [Romboutsia sp.]
MFYLSLATFILYIAITISQMLNIIDTIHLSKSKLIFVSFLAISLHCYLLYCWIDTKHGQNISFSNLLSLITWLISSFTVIATLKKPLENLLVFIFPLTGLSILHVILLPHQSMVYTKFTSASLSHLLMVITTASLLGFAGLQAVMLTIQNKLLKKAYYGNFLKKLPPLETMEQFLFQIIWSSFILLTLLCATAFIYLQNQINIEVIAKLFSTFLTWLLLAALLYGRHKLGWRGPVATRATLLSLGFLFIAFIASQSWFGT